MTIPQTMIAARMHTVGGELRLETLETPRPGDMDVLVRVKACGIVPNLGNILATGRPGSRICRCRRSRPSLVSIRRVKSRQSGGWCTV
ncbi:hypothetical protein ABIA22_000667 [Sinorhizobium fredii]